MPAVARNTDLIGHVISGVLTVTGNITSGDLTVLTNGLATARLTDHAHCNLPTHGDVTISGPCSLNVFYGGLAVARVGDGISCGAVIISGSPTVFVN